MGSQLFHDTVGLITELSLPEFIRNKNLIELGQLPMREQLEVAEIFFLRSQFCLFSGNKGAFPARLLTTGASAALPVCCSNFSVDSSLFPSPFVLSWPPIFELGGCFSFSSGKLLHQLNWYCFYAVIFIMSVAGFTSPVSLCHFCWVDRLAAAVPLAIPHQFLSLPYKYWSVVSSSLPIFCPTVP